MKSRRLVALGAAIGIGVAAGVGGLTGQAQLAAGSAPPEEPMPSEDIDMSSVLDDGVLDVGTAVGNPPWAFVVEGEDDPSGFDMDLIRLIAETAGAEVNIEVAGFPTLIPSLESGRYDVVISSLTIRPERIEALDLLGYIQIATGVLVPAGNPDELTGLEDACGLRVGVAQGSANEEPVAAASEECGDDPIEIVSTQGNDFVALESGQVDLMVLDAAGAFSTAAERDDTFEALEPVYGAGLAGIATAKDAELMPVLQAALLEVIDSGAYDELLEEWNIVEIGYTDAEINPTQ